MRRIIALCLIMLLIVSLCCAAQAENRFSCDLFSIDLPDGAVQMDADALAGYEAAVQADYPSAGKALVIAKNDANDMIIYIAEGTGSDPKQAAESAAGLLLGDASMAAETKVGDQSFWGFACSMGDLRFDIYYLKSGKKSIVIGVTGMDAQAIADLLASVEM